MSGMVVRTVLVALLVAAVGCDGCAGCGEQPAVVDVGSVEPDIRPTEDEPEGDPLAEATEQAESTAQQQALATSDSAVAVAGAIEASLVAKPNAPSTPSRPKSTDEPETGTLAASELNKIFDMHAAAMKTCYERALKRSPGLMGKVRLEVTIATNGSVRRAAAHGTSLRDDTVTSCMERHALTMKFPEPSGGAVRVNKTFSFTPDI